MFRFQTWQAASWVALVSLLVGCGAEQSSDLSPEAVPAKPEVEAPPAPVSESEPVQPTALTAETAPLSDPLSRNAEPTLADSVHYVYPGNDLQAVLDAAAKDPNRKHVKVYAGVYRPRQHGQALIWLNKQHDGITLEAVGEVILTAANPEIANENHEGYPAIVNHVVYFGDGITRNTVLRGFKITGANNFVTESNESGPVQPELSEPRLEKNLFFYTDGGGIKIFGRSYPTIENVEIYDNYSSPCGAGISIDHREYTGGVVLLKNCIFRNNRCPVTGSAVDLLWGSAAVIENCLFVGNKSNGPLDKRSAEVGKWKPEHGAGALTLFPGSRVIVRRCTFTGNRNGVDDSGAGSVYEDSIFWMNNAEGGWPTGARYEVDIKGTSVIHRCFLNGDTIDLKGNLDSTKNSLGCPDPEFDKFFRPRAKEFADAGYRPIPD